MKLAWVMARTWQHELSCWFTYWAAERVCVAPTGDCIASSHLLLPLLVRLKFKG